MDLRPLVFQFRYVNGRPWWLHRHDPCRTPMPPLAERVAREER